MFGAEVLPYVLAFCRVGVGSVFALSFISKIKNPKSFEQTIDNFKILPKPLHRAFSIFFLLGELVVVILLVVGDGLLWAGFVIALLLLVAFSAALLWVVSRKIQTSCGCFGGSSKKITPYDVWRNLGFIFLSTVGLATTLQSGVVHFPRLVESLSVGVLSVVFVILWTNLENVVGLFRLDQSSERSG